MSIIYLGKQNDIDKFHLQAGHVWTKSENGLDVLEETYSGANTSLNQFLNNYKKGDAKKDARSMYLSELNYEIGRSFTDVQITWIGLKNDDKSEMDTPKISKRTSIKTATFQTLTPEPATREVSYIAPELVFSYGSDEEQIDAKYDLNGKDKDLTKLSKLDQESENAFKIIKSVITTEAGEIYHNNAPAALVVALSRFPEWAFQSLETESIKHTPYWTNTEVHAFQLEDE